MNDLITRQAALDALEWKWAGKAAIDAIKNLPPVRTVDPVKHGRWVEQAWGWNKCSVCGATAPSDDVVYEYLTPYCPYCGASMDGGEDETDRGRKGNLQEIQ